MAVVKDETLQVVFGFNTGEEWKGDSRKHRVEIIFRDGSPTIGAVGETREAALYNAARHWLMEETSR